jgi:hypothetical protein
VVSSGVVTWWKSVSCPSCITLQGGVLVFVGSLWLITHSSQSKEQWKMATGKYYTNVITRSWSHVHWTPQCSSNGFNARKKPNFLNLQKKVSYLQDLPSSVVFSVFTIGIVSGNNRKVSESIDHLQWHCNS